MSSISWCWIAAGAAALYLLNTKGKVKSNAPVGVAGGGGGYQPPPPLNNRRGRQPVPPPPDQPPWMDDSSDNLAWMRPGAG